MRKTKDYSNVRFKAEVLKEALEMVRQVGAKHQATLSQEYLSVDHDDESRWIHDTLEEFFADFRKYTGHAYLWVSAAGLGLTVEFSPQDSSVSIKAPERSDIEAIFDVFEKSVSDCKIPLKPLVDPIVFIGHGRSMAWRDLKDHLREKHGFKVEAFETGARAGHTIRDILEELVDKSSFALMVLTGEDEQSDGTLRARQNVIHEAGLFQGRLGFSKAIILLEDGVEEFSNLHGVQHIKFAKNNIKEVFGDVIATLRREFGSITS